MLKSLRLKLFQSHRDTILDLVDGVNVIFGISLHGKTAILRGLNLLLNNRPSGAKFFSNFVDKGKTEIESILSEGATVRIEKDISRDKKTKEKKLDNTAYYIDEQAFPEVGKNVPDEIATAFNMSELNIQKQFDQPFLIIGSAGEFAKTINRVTNLDKPDEWVTNLTKQINDLNRETKILEKQAEEKEKELVAYAGFDVLEQQSKDLSLLLNEIDTAENKADRVDACLARIEDIDKEIAKLRPALSIEQDITNLMISEQVIQRCENRFKLVSTLVKIDTAIKDLQELLGVSQTFLAILELEAEREELDSLVCEIEAKDKTIADIKDLLIKMEEFKSILEIDAKWVSLDGLVKSFDTIEDAIKDKEQVLIELKNQYILVLKEEPQCSECFRPIDDKTLENAKDFL